MLVPIYTLYMAFEKLTIVCYAVPRHQIVRLNRHIIDAGKLGLPVYVQSPRSGALAYLPLILHMGDWQSCHSYSPPLS